MARFTKTVSQLSRAELLSAADKFNTGNVGNLRKRIKNHNDATRMSTTWTTPRYARLLAPQQRARYATQLALYRLPRNP